MGVIYKEQTEDMVNEYLDELTFPAETAGAKAVKRFTQKLPHPDSKIFVGKGKLGRNPAIHFFLKETSAW